MTYFLNPNTTRPKNLVSENLIVILPLEPRGAGFESSEMVIFGRRQEFMSTMPKTGKSFVCCCSADEIAVMRRCNRVSQIFKIV